jgi:hypothetical protein
MLAALANQLHQSLGILHKQDIQVAAQLLRQNHNPATKPYATKLSNSVG